MISLRQWWTAGRPLSARGHLIALAFWLVVGALVVYRLLTADGKSTFTAWALGVAVVGNLVALSASYRNVLRRTERPSSAGGDARGTINNT